MRVQSLLLVSVLLLDFITAVPLENVENEDYLVSQVPLETLEEILRIGHARFLRQNFNRGRRDLDFLGSRGKRGDGNDFFGMRGKKMKDIFIGSRGKKDFDFLGSRGKKATDFYGVRGKKLSAEILKRIMELKRQRRARSTSIFTAVRG